MAENCRLTFKIICNANGISLGVVQGKRWNKLFHLVDYASKSLDEVLQNYIVKQHELLFVVYTFEKFHAYLLGIELIFHTYLDVIRYLMEKKKAKLRLIQWTLFLEDFVFKVKDKRGCENQVVDSLSYLESIVNKFREIYINEYFHDEGVIFLVYPCYTNFSNYLICGLIHQCLSSYKIKKFLHYVKWCFWDWPYLFRGCADNVIRRYLADNIMRPILEAYHSSLECGHRGRF